MLIQPVKMINNIKKRFNRYCDDGQLTTARIAFETLNPNHKLAS